MTRSCACGKVSQCHIMEILIFSGDDRPPVDSLRVLLDRGLSAVHLSQEVLPPITRSAELETNEKQNPLANSVGEKGSMYASFQPLCI